MALCQLGWLAVHTGDVAAGRARFEALTALWREAGEPWGVSWGLHSLGEAAHRAGDLREAAVRYEESLAINRRLGVRETIGELLHDLGHLAVDAGDPRAAATRFAESLALLREVGKAHGVAKCLAGLARVAAAEGDAGRAGRLFGAATAQLEALGLVGAPADRQVDGARVIGAREALMAAGASEADFTAAWATGRAMPLEEALGYALGAAAPERSPELRSDPAAGTLVGAGSSAAPGGPRASAASGRPWPCGLTTREVEVLRLLAARRSNKEIAEALVLSVRTVERHVANIFDKLGVHDRREASAYAALHGLVCTA
jgi:DNA-binding CsgD family transcriptional regulator